MTYAPILGSPSINTSPGSLGGIYNPTNPALALFTSQAENPTAAGAGFFSNSGFSGLNFSSISGQGGGGYSVGGVGSVSPWTGLQNCMGAGNSFIGCLAKGFGAGLGAGAGAVGSGVASGVASQLSTTWIYVGIGAILLIGAFFLIGTNRIAGAFRHA